jgi:quinoprotein glucose dehydrogenase
VIVGSTVRESADPDRPSGVVRAFDVRTGVLRWSFHPITKGANDVTLKSSQNVAASSISGANVWSIISADAERDLVFLPTSSASPDFYGGGRIGRNDFANSVVALRASTGAVVWAFQTVHHDLWDYDVAAQPMLATITRDGQRVDVVIIGTKAGMIFVLDRDTGVPILPVEERAVPPSDVPGEVAWRTQPFSVHPPPLLGTRLTPDSAFGVDSSDLAYCRAALADLRNDGLFTPPSLQGSLEWPGFWGGINWDGLAWDPARERFVTTLKRVAMAVRLHPRDDSAVRSPSDLGREVMQQAGTPYRATRGPLVAPSGNPCTPPPWGSLVSVDVSGIDATVRWTRPLGTVPWLSNFPNYREWGSLVFGGPLITAGGLVFVAATQDDMFRAFDIDSGEELWAAKLPAGGQASPMTYVIDGKQFVVIAAGGRSGIGSPGDYIVAFSLP